MHDCCHYKTEEFYRSHTAALLDPALLQVEVECLNGKIIKETRIPDKRLLHVSCCGMTCHNSFLGFFKESSQKPID